MRLEGRVAIITGSSRGIGESIARTFAKEGAAVGILGLNNFQRAESLASELEIDGFNASPFKVDIRNPIECKKLVEKVNLQLGEVDILVNNAGVFIPKIIEETSEDEWNLQIDVNLKGSFFMSKSVVPTMKKKGYGKIINITSIAAELGFQNSSAYCASKGGQGNMTKAMCLELAQFGINVNAIAPGNIKTEMNASLRADPDYDIMQASKTPSGVGHIDPNELTGAAVYLASEESNSVHGATITIDGGWSSW